MDANNYITLNEVKAHLNIHEDFYLDDALLYGYINASLEVAQRHIGKRFSLSEEDSDETTLIFNPAIKVGCLLYIGHLYANRESVSDLNLSIVPMTISALWDVYREPGVY
ncbi:head-tail connector protein [Gallibacterium anatis]|uniref:Phage gp6-like head-tail connector protein n=1 Tax=Gallibacterium anatis TaxID=750 RepID=A0A0A2XMR1_9PAST|nr:head-tail connector protein [Gallibacterium anatis]KGQ32247.1 hypothetical protein JP32_04910 [Gallibacterium anatis]